MEQEPLENLVMDDRNAGLFRVHRSVFTAPRLLEMERRRVFDQCWIYAGHASEVPRPGDFQTRRVAGRPVIIARGMDGVVRGMKRDQPLIDDELQMRAFWRQWHALMQGWPLAEVPVDHAMAVERA